jgi:hypothetical protein
MITPIECAADALRRHEQAGKKLNEWPQISASQRKRWVAKARIVLEAFDCCQCQR